MEPDFESRVFDEDSKDLILKLLNKDGKLRLGAKGYKEVIAHPWFACKSAIILIYYFCVL
jgi:hypothetical protein